MKIAVVSGGFDPLHSGHISYLNAAKKSGSSLIVLLNSDEWLKKKKGKFFLPFKERKIILENLQVVDEVMNFKDDNLNSCINGLTKIKKKYSKDEIIFCNGGDRGKNNTPEMKVSGIDFIFGVGGNDKKNSSSWILKDFEYELEERVWGKFYNLFTDTGETEVKVKELIVAPKMGLSFQKHFYRSEIWFLSKGACKVNYSEGKPEDAKSINFKLEDVLFIKKEAWHQIINPNNTNCKIIEVQFGDECTERDIERKEI